MSETETEKPTGLALLRRPFPDHQISKLPKPTKQQTEAVKNDYKVGFRCPQCQSWHHRDVVHLDYVGHAALTDRLLDADPLWTWEPAALRDGLPAFDSTGGLWIRLTVCGVTRLGYGHAASKNGADPGAREKEAIGDALRNAAMRFGAALDLWHKGDLHLDESEEKPAATGDRQAPQTQQRPTENRPVAPTLKDRADAFEKVLRTAPKDDLAKAWSKGAKLCAELDTADPERLAELTALYEQMTDIPF